MRGRRSPQPSMLAFVDLEERVPAHHPLRNIRWAYRRSALNLTTPNPEQASPP